MRWALRHLGYRGMALILLGCELIGAQRDGSATTTTGPPARAGRMTPPTTGVWIVA